MNRRRALAVRAVPLARAIALALGGQEARGVADLLDAMADDESEVADLMALWDADRRSAEQRGRWIKE